jgi:hypothetical protein
MGRVCVRCETTYMVRTKMDCKAATDLGPTHALQLLKPFYPGCPAPKACPEGLKWEEISPGCPSFCPPVRERLGQSVTTLNMLAAPRPRSSRPLRARLCLPLAFVDSTCCTYTCGVSSIYCPNFILIRPSRVTTVYTLTGPLIVLSAVALPQTRDYPSDTFLTSWLCVGHSEFPAHKRNIYSITVIY